MTKEQLINFYNLHKEIREVEDNIFNIKYYDWNGFVWFEDLRTKFRDLYKLFDNSEHTLLEWLENIVSDWMQDFNFDLLTEEDLAKLTLNWELSIFKHDEKNYSYAIVNFNTIEEIVDYIIKS